MKVRWQSQLGQFQENGLPFGCLCKKRKQAKIEYMLCSDKDETGSRSVFRGVGVNGRTEKKTDEVGEAESGVVSDCEWAMKEARSRHCSCCCIREDSLSRLGAR